MTKAIYNTAALSVIHAASDDPSRYNINSVHFNEQGATVATDGHMLAIVTPKETIKVEPFMVEIGALEPIAKEVKRARKTGGNIALENSANGGVSRTGPTVPFVATTKAVVGPVDLARVEGEYPDYHQVIPELDNVNSISIGISLAVLETFIAIARQYTGTRKGEECPLHFRFLANGEPEEEGLSAFTAEVSDDDSTLLLVGMPCRLK